MCPVSDVENASGVQGAPDRLEVRRTAAFKAADQLHSIHHFPLCSTQAVESTWSFLPLDSTVVFEICNSVSQTGFRVTKPAGSS